jgi:SAM-dependent methyltransferase
LNDVPKQPFDAYSGDYRDHVDQAIGFAGKTADFYHRIKVHSLLSAASRFLDVRQSSVLDVGCGTGSLATLIAGQVKRFVGIDVSSESISEAKKRSPGNEFYTYGGETFPIEDESMDIVFTSCVMHHIPPIGWPKFVAEMARVVRPEGLVAIIEHNPWNPLTRLAVSSCEFDRDAVLLSRKTATGLLKESGLAVRDQPYILFFPFNFRLCRAVENRMRWLPLGAQYLVVAQKTSESRSRN